ncbi:MAG TPA: hypothetical protein VL307_12415 [Chitinophagaceae bacterium]|nr:hypothetical protein [Chitinophagaceae bacterium]
MKTSSVLSWLQGFLYRNGLFLRPARPRFELGQHYIRIKPTAHHIMGVKRSAQPSFEVSLLPASASSGY